MVGWEGENVGSTLVGIGVGEGAWESDGTADSDGSAETDGIRDVSKLGKSGGVTDGASILLLNISEQSLNLAKFLQRNEHCWGIAKQLGSSWVSTIRRDPSVGQTRGSEVVLEIALSSLMLTLEPNWAKSTACAAMFSMHVRPT